MSGRPAARAVFEDFHTRSPALLDLSLPIPSSFTQALSFLHPSVKLPPSAVALSVRSMESSPLPVLRSRCPAHPASPRPAHARAYTGTCTPRFKFSRWSWAHVRSAPHGARVPTLSILHLLLCTPPATRRIDLNLDLTLCISVPSLCRSCFPFAEPAWILHLEPSSSEIRPPARFLLSLALGLTATRTRLALCSLISVSSAPPEL
ncbi:hypothetical protein B0H13DRAFT_2349939 [Mycena leptocephala]|nr:hypothetical protein B0H13DRAFT_2349939 [Mycena leptocephala]